MAGNLELVFEKLFFPEGQNSTGVQVYSATMSNDIKRGFQVQRCKLKGV